MNETPEQKAKRLGVRLIPKREVIAPTAPYDPNPTVAVCGQCGLEVKNVMGYYCPRQNCPAGLGGLCS